MLPLDVYLQNEDHLVMSTTTGEVSDELKGTRSEKLLRADPEARVVVNFHGVSLFFFEVPSHSPGPSPINIIFARCERIYQLCAI